jgi:tetratricopeptide (TPR) repeat protein
MRAFVFTDKALARHAGQFVWLAINTEESRNAAFLAKFPVSAWPSFFIVDPKSEAITYRWTGGATVAQLDNWLDEARRERAAPSTLRAELERADAANGRADYKAATELYARVLAAAPASFKERPRVVDAYIFALEMTRQPRQCAEEAARAYPLERHLSNAANVAGTGLDCALTLPKDAKGRAGLVSDLEAACREVIGNRKVDFATDDLSSVYQELIAAREDAGDAAGKRAYESAWIALLDAAVADAKTPAERTVFDPHLLAAYLEIGHPERAIPMLEQSQRDFPSDYNPPARLAIAYQAMKDYDHALAAANRALALAYGPRKLTIYRTKASILQAAGRTADAIATLHRAIAFARSLPADQGRAVGVIQEDLVRLQEAGAIGAPRRPPGSPSQPH